METKLIRFFQREIYKQYDAFVEEALCYFPHNRSLQLAQTQDPDFNLLLTCIFAAREKSCGYKQESMILCEKIAGFSAVYCNIAADFRDCIVGQEYIYKQEFEYALIRYLQFQFFEEAWINKLVDDIDIDTMIQFVMGTKRYIDKEILTVACLRMMIAYRIQSTREGLISQYLKHTPLISKNQSSEVTGFDLDGYANPTIEKRPYKLEIIVVEIVKKKPKNKRKVSQQKKIKSLLERGQSFTISLSPVTATIGVKKILIKDTLEAVMEFIESNIPEKVTIVRNTDEIKILFGEKTSKFQHKRSGDAHIHLDREFTLGLF